MGFPVYSAALYTNNRYCVAVPMALVLTPPSKVQRGDRSPVKFVHAGSWKNEFRELWKVYYFGVRGRALAALVIQFANLFASTVISQFLDWTRISAKKRIIYSFYYVVAVHILAWVYAWVVQEQYTSMDTKPVFDWTDKGYVKALFVLILWQWCQQSFQNWLYYLVSTMADNISELSRLSGILRGQESFSQAVSWGLNTKEWYGGRVPMAVNTILLGLAVVPSWLVIQGHTPIEHDRNETITSQDNDEEKAIENYNISEKGTESY
ncbi:hypothetical protein KEM56_000704 [Ascosphaera pollenicola]|nr:hypothetical protein KEM56_000704 [Ascosphaera pollenicola]